MNSSIFLILSLSLVAGLFVPVYAQTASDHVVINEVDINPPGDDASSVSEWVELYNPTNSDVNLGGWEIASTTVLKKTMTIPDNTIIKPGQFLTYSYQSVWFTDSGESVELRDKTGFVIDKTPMISDTQNNFMSWQRIYDGYGSEDSNDWKFVTSTAGSSNGKLVQTQDSNKLTLTVSTEKQSYLFGETVIIKGSVSEEVFVVKPFFQPEKITINIAGPNFKNTVTVYPDRNLNYKTSLGLHKVLGVNEGNYDVSVTYSGVTANTNFSVGLETFEQEEKAASSLSMITDKSQYIPGQLVTISGFASDIIPFQGMKFTITDSEGNVISNGNLYPTNGKFTTTVFLTTVKPVYGVYEVNAEYSDKSVSTTFEVLRDLKEDVPISLWTDKKAYGLGELVTITGRLNQVWVGNLDLEIVQTKQSSIGTSSSGSDSGFKILDGVRITGDGTFTFTFTIPDNPLRLGDYRINVSKDIGSASTVIHAVSNPDTFVASTDPITVNSDKEIYEIGDKMIISGFIADPFSNPSYGTGIPVNISISHEDGSPLEIIGLKGSTRTTGGVVVTYDFTAIPETSGRYSTPLDITTTVFSEGNYVIKAQYLDNVATKTFAVIDSLDLKDGAVITLDKEVYGLGETVSLTGILPPTSASAVDISLTKPDGTVKNSGVSVDKQRFSWSWITPIAEKVQNIKIDEGRDVIKSNFGVYKIRIATDSYSKDLFFKVSADPENDSISKTPIFVSTEKSLYKAGEKLKVLGNVIKREQGDEGLVVPDRIKIQVLDGKFPYKQIHESSVYPDQGGKFSSTFELPPTIFSEGMYTVKALYSSIRTETTFSVANDFIFNLDEPVSLNLSTDASEYHPGDVVIISGKPNKLIYLDKFDVSIIKKSDNSITCGSFYCGSHSGPVTSIRPSPSGSFTHQFIIPDSESSLGSYEVTVDADFETKSILFDVVEMPPTPKLSTVIEKESRIPEKTISIVTGEKLTGDASLLPRVVSGSLLTPSRSDESIVNLRVSAASGACIIGPTADCMVSESTRKPGQIFDIVEVDGMSLKIRYSGSDVRLEKFSILPESSDVFLPETTWNVEVLKDDQVSRFYYKITYKSTE